MHELFKYMMQYIQARLILEWKDLHVAYPQWLTHVVMDDLYYVVTLVVMSLACFAVGMIIGIVWTVV